MALHPTPEGGHVTETAEHYLEAIYYIAHEGQSPRPGGLAEWLDVSAPTVTVTLQRLARDGWLEVAADRTITLTPAGEAIASGVVRRHRILERWLVDVLGLDWAAADREASRLAHGVSELVVARLDEHLGHPSCCPHGNPIPGRAEVPPDLLSLDLVSPGRPVRVARISEVAEHEAPQLLTRLHELGLTPGSVVTVQSSGPRLLLEVAGRPAEVDAGAARVVWVAAS
ncbi:MAG TPA: metal-dependent transcriptional regulator [Candidatus Binatia bacterium]|nr:metal-dependent transcriptional regulator [Candidatus Binatia bacterium]